MKNPHIAADSEDQQFCALDFSDTPLTDKSFFRCSFEQCTFTETSWQHAEFSSCTFKNCSLNQIDLKKCRLHDASFTECTIIGTAFFKCDTTFLFSISFEKCLLKYCNFSHMPLKKHLSKAAPCDHAPSWAPSQLKQISPTQIYRKQRFIHTIWNVQIFMAQKTIA
jgi:uncharacterized protein YjbI with pentapeptide repeats